MIVWICLFNRLLICWNTRLWIRPRRPWRGRDSPSSPQTRTAADSTAANKWKNAPSSKRRGHSHSIRRRFLRLHVQRDDDGHPPQSAYVTPVLRLIKSPFKCFKLKEKSSFRVMSIIPIKHIVIAKKIFLDVFFLYNINSSTGTKNTVVAQRNECPEIITRTFARFQ